jgi:hypothetical protein
LANKVIVDCNSPLLSKILEKHFEKSLTSSHKAPILTDDPSLGDRAILVSEFPIEFEKLELKIDEYYREFGNKSSTNSEIGNRIEKATENFISQLRGILVEK